jgi:hypothetical protein
MESVSVTLMWLFASEECSGIENVRRFFLTASLASTFDPDACCFNIIKEFITISVMCLAFTTCPFMGLPICFL